QAQIVELLRTLQQRHGLAYLFISHDLRVVRALSHHVLVLRQGIAVEGGPAEQIFSSPSHPYTRELLAAAFAISTDGTAAAASLLAVGGSDVGPPRAGPAIPFSGGRSPVRGPGRSVPPRGAGRPARARRRPRPALRRGRGRGDKARRTP